MHSLVKRKTSSSPMMLFILTPCLVGKFRETGLGPFDGDSGDVGSGRSFIKRNMSHQTARQAWT